MNPQKRFGLDQRGHAGKTEFMILVLLVSAGVAFFIPRMHDGILGAVGKTLLDVFLFFIGLVLLVVIVGLLQWAWQSLGEWTVKWLEGKEPPKPQGKP